MFSLDQSAGSSYCFLWTVAMTKHRTWEQYGRLDGIDINQHADWKYQKIITAGNKNIFLHYVG